MFDGRTNLSADVAAEVRRHLGDLVFEAVVPRNVRLSEAPSHGLPIVLYSPESVGAAAYRRVSDELRARDGRPAGPDHATAAGAQAEADRAHVGAALSSGAA